VSRQATWERFATTEHEQLRKITLERFGGWPRRYQRSAAVDRTA
jgi:hypothetical protein